MNTAPTSNNPSAVPSRASQALKLMHAAALAAALVPLASIPAEGVPINCVSGGSGSCGPGSYVANQGEQSNVWKFYTDWTYTDLIYTFEISGSPTASFDLQVADFVTTQAGLEDGSDLMQFPDYTCVPTYSPGNCGLFDVFNGDAADWDSNGYLVRIAWFVNADPLSQPPDDGRNTILHAHDMAPYYGYIFDEQLADIDYDPNPSPADPGISGRGDSFSRFGVFRNTAPVPEPGTILMLGLGALAMFARRRR